MAAVWPLPGGDFSGRRRGGLKQECAGRYGSKRPDGADRLSRIWPRGVRCLGDAAECSCLGRDLVRSQTLTRACKPVADRKELPVPQMTSSGADPSLGLGGLAGMNVKNELEGMDGEKHASLAPQEHYRPPPAREGEETCR